MQIQRNEFKKTIYKKGFQKKQAKNEVLIFINRYNDDYYFSLGKYATLHLLIYSIKTCTRTITFSLASYLVNCKDLA